MAEVKVIVTSYPLEVRAIPMGDTWIILVSGLDGEGWEKIDLASKEALIKDAINRAKLLK